MEFIDGIVELRGAMQLDGFVALPFFAS